MEIRGSLLARNTLLNFLGQAVPLVVGMATIPFIIRGLGTERFGLLSLAWVILGYFSIFDLGLGRATTKYVAEALGKGDEEQIPRLVWTAVTVQAAFGLLGALVLVGITPLLVERILNIPAELVGEAKATFYLLALAIPVILVSSSFSGVLEAKQRFDLVNAIRIPSSISTYLLTLVGLILDFKLPGIVALILVARVGALSAVVIIALRVFPSVKKFSANFALFPRLISFGGWITVSSIVALILGYIDRFLLGALLTMSAITYYTVPFDLVGRLWSIPVTLVMVLFPAFSALGTAHKDELERYFARSIKYLLLVIGPIVFVLVLFADSILELWVGKDFVRNSTLVFQILSLGALVGCLAPVPGALLQGLGRPDILSKLYIFELPFYFWLLWLLVQQMGITGAALAAILRTLVETILLFILSLKVARLTFYSLSSNGVWRSIVVVLGLSGVLPIIFIIGESLYVKAGFLTVVLILFFLITWQFVLDAMDKRVPKVSSVKKVKKQG